MLLRDHQDREVDDWREIEFRSAVDRLLTCYSILEIASLVDFVPSWTSSEFAKDAVLILNNEQLQRFYESYYPSWLVVLFKRRLLRGSGTVLYADDQLQASDLFLALIELDRRFRRQLEGGALLMLLDAFHFGGVSFRSFVDLIGRPAEFMDHVMKEGGKIDINADTRPGLKEDQILTQAVHQFGHFIQFSIDLRNLLDRAAKVPLLRSEFWTYYAYWFRIIGSALNANLSEALSRFLEWKEEGIEPADGARVRAYVERGRRTLEELTSSTWGAEVQRELSRQ